MYNLSVYTVVFNLDNYFVFSCHNTVDVVEFPRRLLHLLRNIQCVLFVAVHVCVTYTIMGIFANVVRYLEIVFLLEASVANVFSGL